MPKYTIETEYKKIISTSNKFWWHWKVTDSVGRVLGKDSCTALTRRGAEKEAKKFIKYLNQDNTSKKTIEYEV